MARVNTRITDPTTIRWDNFLLSHHSTIKGSYGPELERAMIQYMDTYCPVSDDSVIEKITKTTLEELKHISMAFQNLPTFPIVSPLVVNATIKNSIHSNTRRTFLRYRGFVIKHLKPHTSSSNDLSSHQNVKGFCEYVDRLTNKRF